MPKLSIVMPYYRNPMMLARQFKVWSEEWSNALKRDIEVVIVDDASPEPAADVPRPFDLPYLRILRVLEDRPWHQHAARNIGAFESQGDFLLMTDMDHVIPPQTLAHSIKIAGSNAIYRPTIITFGRVDAPAGFESAADWPKFKRTRRKDGSLKPHVNSFLLPRSYYWDIGGYDESFCGIYGTDGRFRRRLFARGNFDHLPDFPLIRIDREVIADASTIAPRKEGREAGAKKRIEREKAARGEADKIVTLSMPWERVV